MYSSGLAKKAFSEIVDGCFERGQDLYAFVLLAYYAKSYKGIQGNHFYNYHLGLGGDGRLNLSSSEYFRFCSFSKVVSALERFFTNQGVFEEYQDIWLDIRSRMIGDCVNKWHYTVKKEDKAKCLDMLIETWPPQIVVSQIANRYWDTQGEMAEIIYSSKLCNVSMDSIKTIGMYYHKLVNGGIERVIQFLTPLFLRMGYRVVLITDIQGSEDYIPLSKEVKRYMIPNDGLSKPHYYSQRANCLSEIFYTEKIDLFIYHAWNTEMLIWDIFLAKAMGVPVAIHCHSIFSLRLLSGSDYFAIKAKIFRLADAVVCLSNIDKRFWQNFNANTFTVLNPPTFDIKSAETSNLDGKVILWVGRIVHEKKVEDALKIFAKVSATLPDAKLKVIGSSDNHTYMKRIKKISRALHVDNSVEFCGFHDDVSIYYKTAAVFLSTSDYEGFSLNIFESKIFGVPIVMYDMPYLTLQEGSRGLVSVAHGDVDNAANHIVELLSNNELRISMGRQAREHALELSNYDYCETWSAIIKSIERPCNNKSIDDANIVMWDTLLKHYQLGMQKYNRGIKPSIIQSSVNNEKKIGSTNGLKYRGWLAKYYIRKAIFYYRAHGFSATLTRIREMI